MMMVPRSSPQPPNGTPSSSSQDPYLLMAAATMFKNGNLTEEQKAGTMLDTQQRSENVEDVSADQSMAGKLDRAATSMLDDYREGGRYALRARMSKDIPEQGLSRQLGIQDVDLAAQRLDLQKEARQP